MNDAGRIGFVIKGEYNNTETYDFLDVVYYGNSSYVAKKLTVGNTPADNNEYWQALAKVPVSAVLGVKGNAESAYRTGNINLTPENIGAVAKSGDTVWGKMKFVRDGDIRFITPDSTTGSHARGVHFMDKGDTDIWGGVGVYGSTGTPDGIYIGAGTNAPWSPSNSLYITNSSIKWKNSNLVTENSGTATTATKAIQDSNGNRIVDTYAKKYWKFVGSVESRGYSMEIDLRYVEPHDFLFVISDDKESYPCNIYNTYHMLFDFWTVGKQAKNIFDMSDNEKMYVTYDGNFRMHIQNESSSKEIYVYTR